MKRSFNLAVLSLFLLGSIVGFGQAPAKPVFAATWKLNSAKSTYSPGPAPKSQVATLAAVANGMSVVSDRVDADGQKVHFEWTAMFDGKDYPVKGDASRDMVSVRKIDDYNLEITNKKGGKVTTTIKAVYEKGGKHRVETVTGTNAQGQAIKNVTSWDRQ
jgi:hypothetical protein